MNDRPGYNSKRHTWHCCAEVTSDDGEDAETEGGYLVLTGQLVTFHLACAAPRSASDFVNGEQTNRQASQVMFCLRGGGSVFASCELAVKAAVMTTS